MIGLKIPGSPTRNPAPALSVVFVLLSLFLSGTTWGGPRGSFLAVPVADGPPGFDRKRADGSGAFATGQYHNLFAEAGHSAEAISNKINAAFRQLFHGDSDNQTVYYEAGSNSNGPLAYITDIGHNDVRTEGLSYGMMIAVQLDKKAEFDALWNWSKTYLYHASPRHPSYGFFSWQARTNASVLSEYVAPDGEEYYVMALYFAAHRWGNGQGIYNYQAEADRLLTDMRHRQPITGPVFMARRNTNVVTSVTAGALFDAIHKMVLFSPSNERARFTDPSYQLPAFYELWSRWGPAGDSAFWAEAAAASRDFFVRVTDPVTGLAPDYANFDGTPISTIWNRGAINFRFDACRTAGNWSVDWSWWGKDPRERDLSDRLQAFFESRGMADYGCQFTLDGRQLDDRHAQGLVAMNAVASLAATHPRAKQFVEALWNMPVPDGRERYYEGLLYLMALLHCSGEFRIWPPPQPSPVAEERILNWFSNFSLPLNRFYPLVNSMLHMQHGIDKAGSGFRCGARKPWELSPDFVAADVKRLIPFARRNSEPACISSCGSGGMARMLSRPSPLAPGAPASRRPITSACCRRAGGTPALPGSGTGVAGVPGRVSSKPAIARTAVNEN